jgi:hypothetical protein
VVVVVVEEIGERRVEVEVGSSIGCGVVCLIDDLYYSVHFGAKRLVVSKRSIEHFHN